MPPVPPLTPQTELGWAAGVAAGPADSDGNCLLSGPPGELVLTGQDAVLARQISDGASLSALVQSALASGATVLQTIALVGRLQRQGWLAGQAAAAPTAPSWLPTLAFAGATWLFCLPLLQAVVAAGTAAAALLAMAVAFTAAALFAGAPWLSATGEALALRWLGVADARTRSWAWMRRRLWATALRARASDPSERAYLALATWNVGHLALVMLLGAALTATWGRALAYGPDVPDAWLPSALARLVLLAGLAAATVLPAALLAWMALSGVPALLPKRATAPLNSGPPRPAVAEQFTSALAHLPLFESLSPETLAGLPSAIQQHSYADGAAILRQGERGDQLCWLAEGHVRVWVEDGAGLPCEVARLGPGAFFGETALLDDRQRRTATVIAEGPVQLISLARPAFVELMAALGQEADRVGEHLRTAAALRSHPLFQGLDAAGLGDLLRAAEIVNADAGQVVVRQGEPGEHLFVVREGVLAVERGGRSLARLQPGAWFGELALLGSQVRTATVTALQPCVLVRLPRHALDGALARDLQGAAHLLEVASERLEAVRRGGAA